MNSNTIICDESNPQHWRITLNRAEKRNALSAPMVEEFIQAMDKAIANDIPAISIQGNGVNLCAGFDFSDIDEVNNQELLWRFVRIQQLLSKIANYKGLTIAVAQGKNFGAGCDIFASCSVRIAHQESMFRMPGVLFGLILGTSRLGNIVGNDVAQRIQMSASPFKHDEAVRIGFATHSYSDDDQLQELIDRLANASSKLQPITRHQIAHALNNNASLMDMGRLVESIMHGDIKQRIKSYINSV